MKGEKLRVLLVEDDEAHAELIRRAFDSNSMEAAVTVAGTLREAEEILEKGSPDILIADFLLPDGRGLELLSSDTNGGDFPIVVMTSFGDEQVAVESIKRGALDYVVKSESSLMDMPHIAERTLREWNHIKEREKAEAEKRDLELQLIRAQKMEAMGTLAGGIAHDFNNILGAVIGYTEMALFELDERSVGHYNLKQVLKAAHRAKDLVKQILAFCRRSEMDKRPVRLDQIVEEALKLLRASLPVSIEIEQEINANVGLIHADASQIHQVVMNLCTNAWHAMESSGGTLKVYLSRIDLTPADLNRFQDAFPGPHAMLTIRDNGHGMTRETLDRIFDPYFTTKEVNKGTGLGMAVVLGIVRGHEGHIRVRSEPGEGTTFEVFFPLAEGQSLEDEKEAAPLPMGREKILLVDDEEALIELGEEMLEMCGYRVTTFQRPQAALESFQKSPEDFDLVITDMTMPGMNGLDLLEKLRQIRPEIPIIVCTGFNEKISETSIKEMGIQALLMKPLTLKAFSETVRRVLDHGTKESRPDSGS